MESGNCREPAGSHPKDETKKGNEDVPRPAIRPQGSHRTRENCSEQWLQGLGAFPSC